MATVDDFRYELFDASDGHKGLRVVSDKEIMENMVERINTLEQNVAHDECSYEDAYKEASDELIKAKDALIGVQEERDDLIIQLQDLREAANQIITHLKGQNYDGTR